MAASAVQSLEISYFLQMTEDEEKVRKAVAALAGEEAPEERQDAEGHHGNAIVLVRYHMTGEEAEAAFHRIVSRMDPEEKRVVLSEIGSHIDEHDALYIRLSKQVLVMKGDAVLTSSDPVRVKVKPRGYLVKPDAAAFYGRLFEASG